MFNLKSVERLPLRTAISIRAAGKYGVEQKTGMPALISMIMIMTIIDIGWEGGTNVYEMFESLIIKNTIII